MRAETLPLVLQPLLGRGCDPVAAGFSLRLFAQLESCGYHGLFAQVKTCGYHNLYTNEMHKETSLQERKLSDYFKNRARNLFQEIVEKKLEEPFKKLIQGFEEPSTEEILQLGEKYVHRSLRGESILSIGKIIHSIKRGRDGAVNVMPFTCMPGNLVSAIATKIEKEYPGFPLLSLSYDGSPQANYLNKIRTFVSQAENYHQKKMSKKYHLTPG